MLEDLCTLLERNASVSRYLVEKGADEGRNSKSEDAKILQTNQFSLSSLEDPVDETGERTKPPETQIEIEDEKGDDDSIYLLMFFSLYCLFEDLKNMRSFIQQSVHEYVDGKIDIMNVAVVADIAIHLARQMIDEAIAAWMQLEK